MAVVTMRELLESGVHFGHQTRRWDPKMRRFIFGERGGIYIINLEQTLQLLEEAAAFDRASEDCGRLSAAVTPATRATEAMAMMTGRRAGAVDRRK